MKILDFRDYDVWKQTKELGIMIYKLSKDFPKTERFGLTDQVRRASVSTLSNIAESCGREYKRDTLQFLYISRGSLFEVEAQIDLAFSLGYINSDDRDEVFWQINRCKKLLYGFIAYIKNKY